MNKWWKGPAIAIAMALICAAIWYGLTVDIKVRHLVRTTTLEPPKSGCILVEIYPTISVYMWDCEVKP